MFNPFEEKGTPLNDSFMDWKTMYPQPYSKQDVDPYTKVRIILMNGIEVEAAFHTSFTATVTTTTCGVNWHDQTYRTATETYQLAETY